jgi:hypothetical protein
MSEHAKKTHARLDELAKCVSREITVKDECDLFKLPLHVAIVQSLMTENFIYIPKPICNLIYEWARNEYPSCQIKESIYMQHRYGPEVVAIRQFFGYQTEIQELFMFGHIQELELTQDGNQGGSYYRVFFTVRSNCTYLYRNGAEIKTLETGYYYQCVPCGHPEDKFRIRKNDWPFMFGGPDVVTCKTPATFLLTRNFTSTATSNSPAKHTVYDVVRGDEFQIKIIHRYSFD